MKGKSNSYEPLAVSFLTSLILKDQHFEKAKEFLDSWSEKDKIFTSISGSYLGPSFSFVPPIPINISDSATSMTRSAIGKGVLVITDDVAQRQLTGKTSS